MKGIKFILDFDEIGGIGGKGKSIDDLTYSLFGVIRAVGYLEKSVVTRMVYDAFLGWDKGCELPDPTELEKEIEILIERMANKWWPEKETK